MQGERFQQRKEIYYLHFYDRNIITFLLLKFSYFFGMQNYEKQTSRIYIKDDFLLSSLFMYPRTIYLYSRAKFPSKIFLNSPDSVVYSC